MSTTEPSAFALVDLLQQADRHGDKVAFHLRPECDDEHDRPDWSPNDLWCSTRFSDTG